MNDVAKDMWFVVPIGGVIGGIIIATTNGAMGTVLVAWAFVGAAYIAVTAVMDKRKIGTWSG